MAISVSVVIMTFNETDLLHQTFDTVLQKCSHEDLREIIIVTAPKSTSENLKAAETLRNSGGDVPVTIYRQKKPYIGNACREVFEIAQGTHIILMPADGEIEIEAAERLIALAKAHPYSVITTSRWLNADSFRGYNSFKLAFNFLFNRFTALLFHTSLTDISNIYQIAPLSLMRALNFREEKEAFYIECALGLIRSGCNIIEIPCKWAVRNDGNAKTEFIKCFSYVGTALRLRLTPTKYILRRDCYEKERLFCPGQLRH